MSIDSCSDSELFDLILNKKSNLNDANAAFEIFYKRHAKFLWNLCYKVCSNFSKDSDFPKAVFQNTMEKIYEHPTFDESKSMIHTWMSRIAKNEMLDLINEDRRISYVDEIPGMPFEEEEGEREEGNVSIERKIIDESLALLDEREKYILLTYFAYKDGNKHLPDSIMESLKKMYGTTSINIRKIKQRALDKVIKFVQSRS